MPNPQPSPLPTSPDCYWVEEDVLLAGEYPGGLDEPTARTKLTALLDYGVRTFIDLTVRGELVSYEVPLQELAAARGLAVHYHRQPIRDVTVPTAGRVREVLGLIDSGIDAGGIVYLHCRGGTGRTGTIVGCWLVERGERGDDALAMLAELRASCAKHGTRSPDTDAQARFVRNWTRGGERTG